MPGRATESVVYGLVFSSLFCIDYILGNGFVDISRTVFCKIVCFIKKSIREEAKSVMSVNETPVSVPVLLAEILALSLTIFFLKQYKHIRYRDHMDELLQESKESLRKTNEFLEKWRLRRVPVEYSYLDEEPQEVKPLNLEVPILHMAIVDTLGTARNQLERGDAGDTINITDSTLLSATSLLDDDLDSMPDSHEDRTEDNIEFKNRYLWDVMEEDGNVEEMFE